MADRSKKKTSPVKGGAAANPAAMATVASHKDDTVKIEAQVEGEVKVADADEEMKVEETIAEQDEEPTVQVDPEFEAEQKRAARKGVLRMLLIDNPAEAMAHASDEDRDIIAELIAEQSQTIRDYSVTTDQLAQEKDALERKLDATNSRLSNVTNLISTTVTQTVGQVGNETATAIEGLKTTVVEHLGKNNGVKNAVMTVGDQVNEDIRSLKKQVVDTTKSVEGKVDGMGAMLGQISEQISSIKPQQPPAQSSTTSSGFSGWPWVVAAGFLLTAVTIIAVFYLNKEDTKIEVEVKAAPAGNTMQIVPPPALDDDAARATSQQVTPGGPGNPLVPSIIIGANPADPCEGLTGKANGECIMNQRRPTDFPDQDWNTVLTVFAEPVAVALEGGGMEACREKFLRATGDDDKALECQAAVKCLVSAEEKRRDCWRIATESFGTKLGMTN